MRKVYNIFAALVAAWSMPLPAGGATKPRRPRKAPRPQRPDRIHVRGVIWPPFTPHDPAITKTHDAIFTIARRKNPCRGIVGFNPKKHPKHVEHERSIVLVPATNL